MTEDRVLVIDDENVIGNLIKDTLAAEGYSVVFIQEAKDGIEVAKLNPFDVIFVDLRMPEIDGIEVLKQIKQFDPDNLVIMITAYPSFESVKECLRWGAFDYITKPFNLDDLIFTTKRALIHRRLNLENKRLMKQISQENIILEKEVAERTEDLHNFYRQLQDIWMSAIRAMAQAIDGKDRYTQGHSQKVAKYAMMIAQEMELSTHEINEIKDAGELCDLGKIAIHDYIFTKPEKLTAEEWVEVRLHPLKGAELLKPLKFLGGVIDLVGQHHERYDGTGYPDGLKGEEIKIGARILALADAFDAMTSERPYRKKPLTKEEAIEEIKKNSGIQFDPKVFEAFLRIVDKL